MLKWGKCSFLLHSFLTVILALTMQMKLLQTVFLNQFSSCREWIDPRWNSMMHLVEALCNNALTTLSTSPGGTDQIQKDAASAQVSADRCRQRWFFYSAKQFF
ncbi:hypothetical protein AMECASPLE_002754 [Ameca splendens]|uniref:Secreted protein n=1 Tax=Ameca splendens TaxID=208324 RepID=A0ABV0YY17_9TELE